MPVWGCQHGPHSWGTGPESQRWLSLTGSASPVCQHGHQAHSAAALLRGGLLQQEPGGRVLGSQAGGQLRSWEMHNLPTLQPHRH